MFCSDGIRDCPNGEDEVDCKLRECPRDKFKCNDGKCIPQVWVCDGDSDCSANEDEDSNCNARNCSENEFKYVINSILFSEFLKIIMH